MNSAFKNNPMVSVVMTVYNNSEFLKEAIDSILKQTYKNFEFIIVNDGSTEKNVYEILNNLDDNRVKIYHKTNSGVTHSLNLAIGVSKGSYIIRQDADDYSDKNRISFLVNHFQSSNAKMLCSVAEIIDSNSEVCNRSEYISNVNNELEYSNPIIHGSVAFSRDLLEKIGLYDDKFVICQSYEMWRRISKHTQIEMISTPLYFFRKYSQSYTAKNSDLNILYRKSIKSMYNDNNELMPYISNYKFYKDNSLEILNLELERLLKIKNFERYINER